MNSQKSARNFSERYLKEIPLGKLLDAPLSAELRERIASATAAHNHAIRIQRDIEDPWISNIDVVTEAADRLQDRICATAIPPSPESPYTRQPLFAVIRAGLVEQVFDAIEIMGRCRRSVASER